MKAGNQNRVVLLGVGDLPWGGALEHDCKAGHEHDCAGLRAWLGMAEDAVTAEDVPCRPKPAWVVCYSAASRGIGCRPSPYDLASAERRLE